MKSATTGEPGARPEKAEQEPLLLEAAALTQRANGAVTGLCRSGRYDEARELLHLLQCAGGAGAPLRLASHQLLLHRRLLPAVPL